MNLNERARQLQSMLEHFKVDKDKYKEKQFWYAELTFSLYQAMSHFVEYAEKNRDRYIVVKETDWYKFLKDFYGYQNGSSNVFQQVLHGDTLSSNDKEYIKEAFKWIYGMVNNIFKPREEGQLPFAYDSIVAGKFYTTLFFVTKYIEIHIEEKLDLLEEIEDKRVIVNMVQNEYTTIEGLETKIQENENTLKNIPKDMQAQIAGMWYRTLDFTNEHLNQEKQELEGNLS